MELYYSAGNQVLNQLRKRGFDVFLDLKLHDIPNTVAGAVRTVAGAGASLLTIHAGGGQAMMQAAAKAADRPGAPRLLAVTVLTSMDAAELEAVGVTGDSSSVETQVLRLARLARASGINGLVCSPLEVAAVRKAMGPDALFGGSRRSAPAATAGSDDQEQSGNRRARNLGRSLHARSRPPHHPGPRSRPGGRPRILSEIQSACFPR